MRSQRGHHNGEKDDGGSDSTHLAMTLNIEHAVTD